MMPTPQSGRESVLHMAVDGFKTLVVRNLTMMASTSDMFLLVLAYDFFKNHITSTGVV